MATICAVCQSDTFWAACDWTTYDGTIITNSTERDAYYTAKYTSLQAWDNAQAKSVSGFERVEILGPWTTADGPLDLYSGWGTSYLAKITIAVVGVARYAYGGNYYKALGTGTGVVINIQVSNVIIDGIFAEGSGTEYCFQVYGYRENIEFYSCIAKGGRNGFYAPGQTTTAGYFAYNCIAYNSSEYGFFFEGRPYYQAEIINCTAYNCNASNNEYRGGISINNFGKIINCISISNTINNFYDLPGVTVKNCISKDTSLNGIATCQTGVTAASTFIDAANGDFRLLSTASAKDSGAFLDAVPLTDIIGVHRDPANIDIGAYEYDVGYVPVLQVTLSISGMAEGSIMAVYKTSDGSAIISPTTISASGSYSTTYSYTGDTQITVVVRKGTSGTKYLPYSAPGLITSGGFGLVVSQVEDLVLNG